MVPESCQVSNVRVHSQLSSTKLVALHYYINNQTVCHVHQCRAHSHGLTRYLKFDFCPLIVSALVFGHVAVGVLLFVRLLIPECINLVLSVLQ